MQKIKKVFEILKCNLWSLVGFELLFKLLSFLIFTPLFLKCFTFILKITRYNYLTLENIFSFLINPLTIFSSLILILLMTFYTMFDITTIIIILNYSYQHQKISIIDAIRLSFKKCTKIISLKNIPLAFLVLFLIPFLNIGISSSFISTIRIPNFLLAYIINSRILLIFCIFIALMLLFLLLKWLYSLHYFVLEDLNFKEARKKSISLSHKNHIKDLLTLVLVQLTISILYIIFVVFGILIIITLNKVGGSIILKSITTTIIWLFIAASFIFILALSTPISYASISVMYYFHKLTKKESIKHIPLKNTSENLKINHLIKKIIIFCAILSFIGAEIFTYGIYNGKYNLNIEYMKIPLVTAHRGFSLNYPENTMIAFQKAQEYGADWIELDIQQTKDGILVVSHDTNVSRTTGVNKSISNMTYEEIKKLDAGSFFKKEFQNEKIPLFEDVLKWAKSNNLKLNIELKPTGKEKNFAPQVVDLLKQYQLENNCVLASQTYSVLENVKKYDPNIKTVYVMSLAVGNILTFDKADYYSIEASSVTQSLVKNIHKSGKEIYVWTLNNEETIQKMIDYQVDNIITDNIPLAKDTIMQNKTSSIINEYIKMIESIF